LSILNNAAGNGWIWWLDHGSADTFMLSIATASAWGGNVLTVTRAGQFNILQNIASTSPTTGALTVAGGVGVNGEIHTGALRAGTYPKGVTASPLQIGYDNATNYGLTIRPATDTSPFAEVFFNAGGSIVGSITTTGAATAYNTTSDERGKPNREPLSPDLARGIVDALEVYDFDKDGNAIRGIGLIAQQAHGVHKSLASPGQTSADWWMAEKAAPMPFVIVNMQQINQRLDALDTVALSV
jgi:hypothetical protein